MNAFFSLFSGSGLYIALLVLLLLTGVGNPVPEDLVLITGGYFAFSGTLRLWPTLVICVVGVLIGDGLLYWLGRHYGQKIIAHRRLRRLLPIDRVDRIRTNFQKWGHWTILLARFLVGLRSATFLVSGVMHVRFRTFLFFDLIGALVSVPLFVGLGYIFGNNIESLQRDISHFGHWAMAAAIVLIVAWVCWLWWQLRTESKADEQEQSVFAGKTISDK